MYFITLPFPHTYLQKESTRGSCCQFALQLAMEGGWLRWGPQQGDLCKQHCDSSPCPGSWTGVLQQPLYSHWAALSASTALEEGTWDRSSYSPHSQELYKPPSKGNATLALIIIHPSPRLPQEPWTTLGSRSWWLCRQEEEAQCALLKVTGKHEGVSLSPLWQLKGLSLISSQEKVITVAMKVSATRKPRISPTHSVLWERDTMHRLWYFFSPSPLHTLLNLLAIQPLFPSRQRQAMARCHQIAQLYSHQALLRCLCPDRWQQGWREASKAENITNQLSQQPRGSVTSLFPPLF